MVITRHSSSRLARLRQFVQSISHESQSALARQIGGEVARKGVEEYPSAEEAWACAAM